MKGNYFKILNFVLSFGIMSFSLPNASAGGELSKSQNSSLFPNMQQALEITANEVVYSPTLAKDGGKAYFWAWNGVIEKKGFVSFTEKYKCIKNNTKSAKLLPDSRKDKNWITVPTYGNINTLKSFEESNEPNCSKYLLRIDEKNNLIYTVRKSGDLYLFTFYIATIKDNEPMLFKGCTAVSSDMRNVKNLLLPTDRELLNQN